MDGRDESMHEHWHKLSQVEKPVHHQENQTKGIHPKNLEQEGRRAKQRTIFQTKYLLFSDSKGYVRKRCTVGFDAVTIAPNKIERHGW